MVYNIFFTFDVILAFTYMGDNVANYMWTNSTSLKQSSVFKNMSNIIEIYLSGCMISEHRID